MHRNQHKRQQKLTGTLFAGRQPCYLEPLPKFQVETRLCDKPEPYRHGHLHDLQMHKKTAKKIHTFILSNHSILPESDSGIQYYLDHKFAFAYTCHEYCIQRRSSTFFQDKAKVHTSEQGPPPSLVPIIDELTPTVHAHQEPTELIAFLFDYTRTVFSRALFVEKHEPRVGSYSSTPIAKELKPYSIFPRDTECIHFVTLHLRTIKECLIFEHT
ncbi:uncharacterized protein F5891DRAFT_626084 [Suillus fuscotomentosus]|uniref:Uncharacterized protein n=1 Tax=Suillus fuscotomentosus TaxID=1912939 RepID=A0AAD4EGS4_9AGAM|nr:uncharacterized protein F5891DRAFT_626084 [Suillus fuscotomentosus]KAG1905777.1 hypothetical protein F5891DRAFT_626084 [Suillus fuscotomentosus]